MTATLQTRALPANPSLDHLRKEAKRQLAVLRARAASAQLTDAQLLVARAYGFPSWRALKQEVDRLRGEIPIFSPLSMADNLPGRPRGARRTVTPNADQMASICLPLCALPLMVLQLTGPIGSIAAIAAALLH